MPFTTCPAGAFVVTGFFIFNSNWVKMSVTVRYAITLNCSKGVDGGQSRSYRPANWR